jgi:hypothetical protein
LEKGFQDGGLLTRTTFHVSTNRNKTSDTWLQGEVGKLEVAIIRTDSSLRKSTPTKPPKEPYTMITDLLHPEPNQPRFFQMLWFELLPLRTLCVSHPVKKKTNAQRNMSRSASLASATEQKPACIHTPLPKAKRPVCK